MIEFFGGRSFETENLATLGIEAGHDVLDGAVFTGRVHGLEDDEERVNILSVKLVLKIGEAGDAGLERGAGVGAGKAGVEVRREVPGKRDLFAGLDAEAFDDFGV